MNKLKGRDKIGWTLTGLIRRWIWTDGSSVNAVMNLRVP
jgi:hypothetical protein